MLWEIIERDFPQVDPGKCKLPRYGAEIKFWIALCLISAHPFGITIAIAVDSVLRIFNLM